MPPVLLGLRPHGLEDLCPGTKQAAGSSGEHESSLTIPPSQAAGIPQFTPQVPWQGWDSFLPFPSSSSSRRSAP